MKVGFAFQIVLKMANEHMLVDSGMSENFLDCDIWKGLKIGRFKLKKVILVHNVDGTANKQGAIIHTAGLKSK